MNGPHFNPSGVTTPCDCSDVVDLDEAIPAAPTKTRQTKAANASKLALRRM
jgi:hypothetical protein